MVNNLFQEVFTLTIANNKNDETTFQPIEYRSMSHLILIKRIIIIDVEERLKI